MPLDKLVLILVLVIIAAGVTVWLGDAGRWPRFRCRRGWSGLHSRRAGRPMSSGASIADRVGNAEDDHYDEIEK